MVLLWVCSDVPAIIFVRDLIHLCSSSFLTLPFLSLKSTESRTRYLLRLSNMLRFVVLVSIKVEMPKLSEALFVMVWFIM